VEKTEISSLIAVVGKPKGGRNQRTGDWLFQIFVEPGEHLIHSITLVSWFQKQVAFVGVDDELCWDI